MEKVIDESLTLALSSSSFLQDRIQGTISDFITQLYKTLIFPKASYEVGLSQIIFKLNPAVFSSHSSKYLIHVEYKGNGTEKLKSTFSLASDISEPFIPSFVSESNELIEENKVPVLFTAKSNQITIKLTKEETTISFSPRLKELLGISSDKIEETETILTNVDFQRKSNLILIGCDVMKPQIFGERFLKILKTLPNTFIPSTIVNLEFNPIQYFGLETEIDAIRVKVMDENFELLELDPNYGVTCVLHVKAI
ncbi:hypothetical protein Fcan01_19189 [Folsomia candida]|uniref:Uncharacterized protein n=1 Tax=Folsomia candida TaxID=158441 RepID=A0A226DMA8_FOLCA|nr:hypothetical protein Fcan01_19189 [Folsomia candida]